MEWDESSTKFYDEFGITKVRNFDSDNDTDDTDDEDDDLDLAHKFVRRLCKATYDKWRLTNMQQMYDGYRTVVGQAVIDLLIEYLNFANFA